MFELIRKFWPDLDLKKEEMHEQYYASFFDYIGRELASLKQHRYRFSAGSFDETFNIMKELKESRAHPRKTIMMTLQRNLLDYDNEALLRSIELTLRLCLTLNIRSDAVAVGPVQAHLSSIDWEDDISLEQLVQAQFISSKDLPKGSNTRIDPAFTAAYLTGVCRVKIHWTDNLADHLRFDRKWRVVTVYQHKICLINHSKSSDSSIIPLSVLEEAIDTLNLLFPFGDPATKCFLLREKKLFYGLGLCSRPRKLDLRAYSYWRDQLLELIDAYNEPPHNWWQLFSDRRNKMQWATFWIAFFVFILTLISIACGTVSTIYSIKQYNLALAQACSTPLATSLLPSFCM
jgi:hypothetical protein